MEESTRCGGGGAAELYIRLSITLPPLYPISVLGEVFTIHLLPVFSSSSPPLLHSELLPSTIVKVARVQSRDRGGYDC